MSIQAGLYSGVCAIGSGLHAWFRFGDTYCSYGPDDQRFKQVDGGRVVYYVNGGQYQEIVEDGVTTQRSYVGGYLVRNTSEGATTMTYLHRDHLGSVEAMSDGLGQLINRMSFSPWGKRQKANWDAGDPTGGQNGQYPTEKGFTGHEMLDSTELVHMNGRVYDPVIGRFLSPDIAIQAPYNSQSFNRYSYVWNNPLSMVDPTGYYCGFTDAATMVMKSSAVGQITQMHIAQAMAAIEFFDKAGESEYEGEEVDTSDLPEIELEDDSGDDDAVEVIPLSEPAEIDRKPLKAEQEENPAIELAEEALEDGRLTLPEANKIWRANNDPNFELTVDASQLTVSLVLDFNENGEGLGKVTGADWFVHGSVSLSKDSDGNIAIASGEYDFQPHGSFVDHPVRNALTYGGFWVASQAGASVGTDFLINYSGQPNVIR